LTAAYVRCRQLHARHGRTYYLATLLLRGWKRRHVHALYGFTRYADELVDDLASTLDRSGRAAACGPGRRYCNRSGWAGRLGGGGGWRCLGEPLRLLDELAEPLDGPLVGAEVVALQGLLGAPVLLGLLLEDPRQRR
jgi:Squalene/phytoene synthase